MKKKVHNDKVSLDQIGEFGLIDCVRRYIPLPKNVIRGIGDDAAILPLDTRRYMLLTTDMIIQGRHFNRTDDYKLIGRKALAINISDIAAMGGISRFAVVALGVPKKISLGAVKGIYRGIHALARQFDISIVGGDTISSDRLFINVSLIGDVDKKKVVLRSGAKKGDKIFVTGPLGNSLGNKKHFCFMPRQKEAQILARFFQPTAMIDISDGLIADLGHILRESHVGAILDFHRIPRHPGASFSQALYDGEDFELLFTASPIKARVLERQKKVKCFCIGDIVDRPRGVYFKNSKSKLKCIPIKGYRHF